MKTKKTSLTPEQYLEMLWSKLENQYAINDNDLAVLRDLDVMLSGGKIGLSEIKKAEKTLIPKDRLRSFKVDHVTGKVPHMPQPKRYKSADQSSRGIKKVAGGFEVRATEEVFETLPQAQAARDAHRLSSKHLSDYKRVNH